MKIRITAGCCEVEVKALAFRRCRRKEIECIAKAALESACGIHCRCVTHETRQACDVIKCKEECGVDHDH